LKAKIIHINITKAQPLATDTREDVLYQEEMPTIHPSKRQVRRAALLITRMLDSSSALPTSSRDILHIMTEFLSQFYKVTTLNCELLRRMDHEASKAVPTKVRKDLVATITGTKCNLAVLRGAPNKSPGWN